MALKNVFDQTITPPTSVVNSRHLLMVRVGVDEEGKHGALRSQKPLRLIRDGEDGGGGGVVI